MTARLTVPPGRAGRLWLVQRLETARRGADLLDRKLRILRTELARQRDEAARAAEAWNRCQAAAEEWLLRARLLGGQRAIRLADDGAAADVAISYTTSMGIRFPASVACAIPHPATWDAPVLRQARQAHGAALAAGVRHAAAAAALRIMEAETTATQYRLRAVRDRWIPRLEAALAEVTFAIEELERADAARLRRAAAAASGEPRPDAVI